MDGFRPRIVIFLRRQDGWIESIYNQQVKTMATELPYADYIEKSLDGLDLLGRLREYEDIVGRENIVVLPFEREQMPDGLLDTFFSAVGIDPKDLDCERNPTENLSYSRVALEILKRLPERKRRIGPEFRGLHSVFSEFSRQTKKSPPQEDLIPPAVKADLLRRFAQDNSTIAREYLGRSDGRLFFAPEPGEAEWQECTSVPTEDVAKLVQLFIAREREQTSRYETRISELVDERAGHRACIERMEEQLRERKRERAAMIKQISRVEERLAERKDERSALKARIAQLEQKSAGGGLGRRTLRAAAQNVGRLFPRSRS
jgi:hypothetical protein